MYDLIIIGAGPAGMTAAVYAARKKLHTLLVTEEFGGQPLRTLGVENYMGYQYVTGPELMQKFETQVKQFPIDKEMTTVTDLVSVGDTFTVKTTDGKDFQGKSVIIAAGKRARKLNVAGEDRLNGRGVSYCATCDGPLFEGRDVAVVGGGNSALSAAAEMSKIAKHVYLIALKEYNADPILVEKIRAAGNITELMGYETQEIQGEEMVTGLVIQKITTGERKILPVQGVFVEIGLIPNSDFAARIVKLNARQEIIIDCLCHTNIPGLFAAGDVTNVPEKQIVIAAGEGAKAALQAYGYLLKKR